MIENQYCLVNSLYSDMGTEYGHLHFLLYKKIK